MAEHRITSRRGIDIWLTQKLQMSVIGRRYVEAGVDDTFTVNGVFCKATETQFGELGAAIYAIYFGSTHLSTVEEAFNDWIARYPELPVRNAVPSKPVDSPFPIQSTSEQQVLRDVGTIEASIRSLIASGQELTLRFVYLRTALQMIADGPNAGKCLDANGAAQAAQDALQWLNDREVKGGG